MEDIEGQQADGPGLIESVWRYRYPVLAIALVFALLGVGYAKTRPVVYSVSARVGLQDPPRLVAVLTDLPRYTASIATFALTSPVLAKAAASMGEKESTFAANTSASASTTATEISVTTTAPNAAEASARLAAVLSAIESGLTADQTTRTNDQIAAIGKDAQKANDYINSGRPALVQAGTSILTTLFQSESALRTELARFGNGVRFVDLGTPTASSSGLKYDLEAAAVGGIIGLVLAMAGAWIWADRHQVVEEGEFGAALLGTSLLGEVPTMRPGARAALTTPSAMPAPPFQFAATALESNLSRGIVVVTGVHGSGTTVTALNLAAAAARQGRRTLVVDADNAARALSRLVGLDEDQVGLSELAAGTVDFAGCSPLPVDLGAGTQFDVIAAGAPDPDAASLYRSESATAVFAQLRSGYDLVIVDSPPLSTDPDAASLATHADGLLIVLRSHVLRRDVVDLRRRIDVVDLPLVGVVFNRSNSRLARSLSAHRRSLRPRATRSRTRSSVDA